MARITVDDCLEKVNTRFELVHIAAKRVRQIREGSEYLVNSPKNEDIVVALREVAAGKIFLKKEGKTTEEENENTVEETTEAKTDDEVKTEEATEAKAEDTIEEKVEEITEDTTEEKKED